MVITQQLHFALLGFLKFCPILQHQSELKKCESVELLYNQHIVRM